MRHRDIAQIEDRRLAAHRNHMFGDLTKMIDQRRYLPRLVTGMSMMVPEVATKRLELLKEAVPGISRVLVLSYLADPIASLQVKAMQQAAGSLGVTLQIHDIQTVDDLPAAFDAGAKERAEGLLVTAESIFVVQRGRVSELAARYRCQRCTRIRSSR